jgi:hypothetical protein
MFLPDSLILWTPLTRWFNHQLISNAPLVSFGLVIQMGINVDKLRGQAVGLDYEYFPHM